MKNKHKFKIGDIVRHASTKKHQGIRMLIIATGELNYDDHSEYIYHVTGQKGMSMDREVFMGAYISEKELILADED